MKKYEYKTELFNPFDVTGSKFDQNKLDEFLRDYGDEGWELINVVKHISSKSVYYFKKEV